MGTRIRNLKIYILNQLYFNKNFKNKIILINFNEIQFLLLIIKCVVSYFLM